jgi:Fe-S-cluster containining protein
MPCQRRQANHLNTKLWSFVSLVEIEWIVGKWIMAHMNRNLSTQDEFEAKAKDIVLKFAQGYHAESAQLMLELIQKTGSDVDRYFPYLYYGEILMKMSRWEDSRDVLIQSAQIALKRKDLRWLVLSHEKLGDLSAAEGNWFAALHDYRYGLRNAASFLDRSAIKALEAKANAARRSLDVTLHSPDSKIIPLAKEYLSGNMAISFVHRDIFLKTYFAHCLQCNFCHDACCSYGADIDIQNVEKIQQRKEEILPFIRPSDGEWFEAGYSYYEEYVGSQYTRINTQGPRCIFISKDQRGCGLHRYAISKQMDYHEIKPLVCILFPLSFGEGILSPAPELDDNSLICSGSGYSAYQSLRNELEHYFGLELIAELDGIEKEVLGGS